MVGVGVQLPFHFFFLWQIVNMTLRLKCEKYYSSRVKCECTWSSARPAVFSQNCGEAGKTENQRSFNWNQKSCMNFIRIKTEVTIHSSTSVTTRTEIHWILAKTRTLMWSFKDRYLTRVRRLSSGGRSGSGVGRFYLKRKREIAWRRDAKVWRSQSWKSSKRRDGTSWGESNASFLFSDIVSLLFLAIPSLRLCLVA